MWSRNASSSRAIPVEKNIKHVEDLALYPLHWGANQKGMQAYAEVDAVTRDLAMGVWDEAKNAADVAATLTADAALPVDDCKRSTNRLLQRCVDAATESARLASEAADTAEKAAVAEADSLLALDDCKRSTNKFLQRCIDAAVAKAKAENDAVQAAEAAAQNAKNIEFAEEFCSKRINRNAQSCKDLAASKKAAQLLSPKPKASVKVSTITCVKGKTSKKVTGSKPVCPAGFKKK
jgi:hypothetical protein